MSPVFEELAAIYSARGDQAYFGEPVSILQHGLQCAHFARAANASESLVVAALLHDIGHLLEDAPDDIAQWTSDARHEASGSRWIAKRFRRDVSEPVRLHVAAKRYLCATNPRYFDKLSSASVRTLELQGGPMSAQEAARFEREACFEDALRLRQWDDQGKVPGLVTARFEDYAGLVAQLAGVGHRHGT